MKFTDSIKPSKTCFCQTSNPEKYRLIGATTHNPRYYIIDLLLSRSQLFTLESLQVQEIEEALLTCMEEKDRGLGSRKCLTEPKAINQIARYRGRPA